MQKERKHLTAAPESRPNIFRLSGFDFKRISYILLASKYPIPANDHTGKNTTRLDNHISNLKDKTV